MPFASWMPLSLVNENASEDRLKELVVDMPFEEALFFCCLINLIVCNQNITDDRQRQYEAMTLLTLGTTKDAVFRYLASSESPYVIGRRNILELMKWIASYSEGTGTTVNSDNFLKAAIMAGDIAAARHDESLDCKEGESSEERMRKATPAIREMALWGLDGWFPLHSLGRVKCVLVDRFFNKQKLNAAFEQESKLTLDEFLICVAGIATLGLGQYDPERSGRRYRFQQSNLWAKAVPSFKIASDKFFAKFSISVNDLRNELKAKAPSRFCDFKFLRPRPIVRFNNGECLIADPVMLGQLIAVGPVFQTLSVGVNEVFGDFGDAFEGYVEDIILSHKIRTERQCASTGVFSFNRKITEPKHEPRELSDVTITVGRTIFLIETKGVWFKDDVLTDLKPEAFWKEINNKYGMAQSKAERNKGFAQLADSILAIANGAQLILQDGEDETAKQKMLPDDIDRIYPILLVHDSLFNASGWLPRLLAEDFARLLKQTKSPPEGGFKFSGSNRTFTVANLIVLTIQDLERLISVEHDRSLSDSFADFAAKDGLRLALSFSQYASEQGPVRPEHHPLVAPSMEIMRKAGRVLLGGEPEFGYGETARKAYELWESRGCQHGNDLRDWFDAEKELQFKTRK